MSNSKYSQWFKIEPGTDYAICKVGKCGAKLSRSGQNSTSLRRHLEGLHKDEWKQFEKNEKSIELKRKAEVEKMSANLKKFASSIFSPSQSSKPTATATTPSVQQVYGNWSPDGPCTKKVHRALTQMIADCNLPLSLIEHAAFKNFCVALQPLYVPPSRDTLTNRYLVELCDEYERKIADDLKEAKHISLTSDVGTTKNQKHALVSMTAHFIGSDGQPKHCYPSVVPLRVRHTGLAIASVLELFDASFGEDDVKSMLKNRAYELASDLLEPVVNMEIDALDSSDGEPDDPIMKLVAMAKAKEAKPIKKRRPSGVVDAQQKVNVEVETYLSSPIDAKADPFVYWHRHRETLPILHGLAMRYLSAPATSAESERLFSTATAIFTHLRQSMTGTTFQKLVFLSRNMGLYGY